jgi:hypothetical protein
MRRSCGEPTVPDKIAPAGCCADTVVLTLQNVVNPSRIVPLSRTAALLMAPPGVRIALRGASAAGKSGHLVI